MYSICIICNIHGIPIKQYPFKLSIGKVDKVGI